MDLIIGCLLKEFFQVDVQLLSCVLVFQMLVLQKLVSYFKIYMEMYYFVGIEIFSLDVGNELNLEVIGSF